MRGNDSISSTGRPATVQASPLPNRLIWTYGTGQSVENLILGVIGFFLLFYLTSVCGLAPEVAGAVLFISLVIDALVDPLIGAFSDGCQSSWGRRHPFMAAGVVLVPLSVIVLFILPSGLPAGWIIGYVLVVNVAMRVSNSLFILPYNALTAEFSSDYAERSRIMIARLVFAVAATAFAFYVSFSFIFRGENSLSDASSYVLFALTIAGLALITGITATAGTLRKAKSLIRPPEQHSPISRFFPEVRLLFKNPSFIALFFGVLVYITATGFVNSLNLHVFRYYWELQPEQMRMPTIAQPVGMLTAIPISLWLIRVVEKQTIMFIAIAVLVFGFGIPPLLKQWNLLEAGSMASLSLVVLSGITLGMSSGLSFVAFGSMVPDAIDEHELLFKVRREGLYFSSLVFAGKTGTGLGGLLAGVGLAFIGFPTDPGSEAGAAQPAPSVIARLGLLWGPVFVIALLPSAVSFNAYKLTRSAHERVLAEIRARSHGTRTRLS